MTSQQETSMWTYRNAGWTLHAISHAQPQLLVWMPEDRAAGAASIEVFRLPDSINLLEFWPHGAWKCNGTL